MVAGRFSFGRVVWLVCALGLSIAQAPAQPNAAPIEGERSPVPPTPAQKALIAEGIKLHGGGDYPGAIAKYKQVLEENPDEVEAIYEVSLSYFHNRDYKSSLAAAERGMQFRSDLVAGFHLLAGNALDELGRREEALAIYRKGVRVAPRQRLLHYNLALSLYRAGQRDEAREAVQSELAIAPSHASSHLLLGEIYRVSGFRIPAILAISRFLQLEPISRRSGNMLTTLQDLLGAGVTKSGDKQINIRVETGSRKDEGDFEAVGMALGLAAAYTATEKRQKENPFERLVTTYTMLGEVLGRLDTSKQSGFAARYYAPYFAAVVKEKHTAAFVAQAWQWALLDGAKEWRASNAAAIAAFKEWDQRHVWPNSR